MWEDSSIEAAVSTLLSYAGIDFSSMVITTVANSKERVGTEA